MEEELPYCGFQQDLGKEGLDCSARGGRESRMGLAGRRRSRSRRKEGMGVAEIHGS